MTALADVKPWVEPKVSHWSCIRADVDEVQSRAKPHGVMARRQHWGVLNLEVHCTRLARSFLTSVVRCLDNHGDAKGGCEERKANKPAALTASTEPQATVSISDSHAQGYCTNHIPNGNEHRLSVL